jgi:hypothetical protein
MTGLFSQTNYFYFESFNSNFLSVLSYAKSAELFIIKDFIKFLESKHGYLTLSEKGGFDFLFNTKLYEF